MPCELPKVIKSVYVFPSSKQSVFTVLLRRSTFLSLPLVPPVDVARSLLVKHHQVSAGFAILFASPHNQNLTTATMSDSDSSGLSSAPEEEVKKLAPIFQRAKKATKKAAPPPKASPPRPKREPSPPHEETLADNPDIAVSRLPDRREMARLRRACRAPNQILG